MGETASSVRAAALKNAARNYRGAAIAQALVYIGDKIGLLAEAIVVVQLDERVKRLSERLDAVERARGDRG